MKNAYTLVAEFRFNLLRRDQARREELLAAYRRSFLAIEEEIQRIAEKIISAGGRPALFREQRRLYELQRQVSEAIRNLTEKAAAITTSDQRTAVNSARDEARQLIEAKVARLPRLARAELLTTFEAFPADVIAELVGKSARHPIDEVFDGLAKDLGQITGERIKHALQRGVTLGESPEKVTRRIISEVNANQGNARRPPVIVRRLHSVVRNETFRAYRRATIRTYQQNDDVVKGWRWVSRKDPHTCIICWSQDGRIFPLSTPFASHHNCRCVVVPALRNEQEVYVTGPEAFDDLEPGVQKAILGNRAFELFAADEVEIGDFVEVVNSRKWGPTRMRKTLDDVLKQRKVRA